MESDIKYVILSAVLIWNIAVFIIYGIDKRRAVRNKWRISEKTLILSALLGGGIGAFSGMFLLRHKTKHMKFLILIPVSLFMAIGILAYILFYI